MKTAKLTAKEFAVLTNLLTCDYARDISHSPLDPDHVGHSVWAWCASGPSLSGKAVPGVVASLSKKGFVICCGYGDDASTRITAAGHAAYVAASNK